ncbi:putative PE-PGRS family protein PE_PGRS24 [Mycobacterium simulans]|uniref:Putative PE-PGRS family protein PE_PGRS24 n=1 Tax=Mycobacterium simulans TaxID=627089 RepID=A0A7Z7IJ67_9MYCO|nr:PE family protein [Mycobacterium simulans]SOJ54257.1 putative PE-PGRS family protein PE_PGRS24 [Mycobacterium simulans]
MSLMVAPELITDTATRVENLGSMIRAANAAAAAPTMGLLPAGADDISAVVSEMFAEYGSAYQALGAQAAEFREQLVERYGWASRLYADTEAASVGRILERRGVRPLFALLMLGQPLWFVAHTQACL